jgi:putative membrane protein
MRLITHLVLAALAIGIAAYLLPGVSVTLLGALILAVVLGVVQTFIKPIINLLTLPLTILTLGLFSLVVNALIIILLGLVIPGFSVAGFWSALLFALILALINAFFHSFDKRS